VVERVVSARLYPPAALEHAKSAFRGVCRVEIRSAGPDLVIAVNPLSPGDTDSIHEFFNFALVYALEAHLEK